MLHYLQGLFQALDTVSILDAIQRVAAILLCISVHETCHGLAALALGDPTARQQHRLSLNPLRHIDWLGLVMMFVFSFGWAKPVQVNPRYFKNPKWGMALTALAGPVSNLLLAIVLLFLEKWYLMLGIHTWIGEILFNFAMEACAFSLGLGIFNLIPIPPLDGSKVLAAFLPDRQYVALMRYERYGILVLLALSFAGIGSNLIADCIIAVYDVMYRLVF